MVLIDRRWQSMSFGSAFVSAGASFFVAPVSFVCLAMMYWLVAGQSNLPLGEIIALMMTTLVLSVPFGVPFTALWWFCLTLLVLAAQMMVPVSFSRVIALSIAVGIGLLTFQPLARWYGFPTTVENFAVMAGAATIAGTTYWLLNSIPAQREDA